MSLPSLAAPSTSASSTRRSGEASRRHGQPVGTRARPILSTTSFGGDGGSRRRPADAVVIIELPPARSEIVFTVVVALSVGVAEAAPPSRRDRSAAQRSSLPACSEPRARGEQRGRDHRGAHDHRAHDVFDRPIDPGRTCQRGIPRVRSASANRVTVQRTGASGACRLPRPPRRRTDQRRRGPPFSPRSARRAAAAFAGCRRRARIRRNNAGGAAR